MRDLGGLALFPGGRSRGQPFLAGGSRSRLALLAGDLGGGAGLFPDAARLLLLLGLGELALELALLAVALLLFPRGQAKGVVAGPRHVLVADDGDLGSVAGAARGRRGHIA